MISTLAGRPYRRLVAATALGLALTLVACADDGDTADPPCEAREDLAAAVQTLEDVDVVQDGTDALRDAVADVGAALETVGDSERSELGAETEAVRVVIDELRGAVASTEGQSPSQVVSTVSSAVTDLADAVGALGEALERECG